MRPSAAEGGAAIHPELPGPVVCDNRTASRVLAELSKAAFEWIPACSAHQRCCLCGPVWGVIRPSRDQDASGST